METQFFPRLPREVYLSDLQRAFVYPSPRRGKKFVVFVETTAGPRAVHFGAKGYRHNYSEEAWRSYLARSAGIRDGAGRLTAENPLSANFWARRILWPGRPGWTL